MADMEPNPPDQPQAEPEVQRGRVPSEDEARVMRWERTSSRVLFVVVILGLVVGMAMTADHKLPRSFLLAAIATFMAVKLALAFLGLRAGWKAWPALVLETAAFGVVGWIVSSELRLAFDNGFSILLVAVTAALLGGAGFFRRKAAS